MDRRRYFGIAFAIFLIGCSRSPGAPSMTVRTLHGEVFDSIGDMLVDSRLPLSPDLSYATVDVSNGEMTIVVGFAPGTFDRESMAADVFLDTDENPSTGAYASEGIVAGADFRVSLDVRASAGSAGQISRYSALHCGPFFLGCFESLGRLSVTATGSALQTVVPLSMFGATDGHVTFQVRAVAVTPITTFDTDLMPNVNLAPGRVQ